MSVLGVSARNARDNPHALRDDLSRLALRSAARVAVSLAKRDAVFQGENLLDLVNAKRLAGYRIGTLGDAMLDPVKQPSDYQIAKSGGRNSGFYNRFKTARTAEIEKSIRSFSKRIAEHQKKVRDPDAYLKPDCTPEHRADLISRYWPEEIADFHQQCNILRGILEERGHGND